ncbi:MAG: hypothetical protein C0404_12755 [Verrucomicrobia bacterium]|nr:hypothetical protein [Verrucomicrobiota bacterium]
MEVVFCGFDGEEGPLRLSAGRSRGMKDGAGLITRLAAVCVGLCCLTVYVLTLCPSVPSGDGAEFVTAACTLSVAHPSGYPLHTLLGKLFTFIPFGSIAWRVNLLSAVADAGAAVLVFLGVVRLTRNVWPGLFSAGLFAFSPLIWRYAVIAEVFPLNNFFVALLFYLAIRYEQERGRAIAYAGALAVGLGLSNHHALLFYGVPLCLWILWIGRKELWNLRSILILTGLFGLGFLPYLHLLVAGSHERLASWGDTGNIAGFVHHFLRKDFGTLKLGNPELGQESQLVSGLTLYAKNVPVELLYIGPLLAIVGLLAGLRKGGRTGFVAFSALAFCFYMVVFHYLANLPIQQEFYQDIHSRFWQQANLPVCIWAGLGVAWMLAFVERRPASLGVVCRVLVVAMATLQVALNYRREDQSRNVLFRDFGRAVLGPLPKDALLITRGDLWVNTVRYLQLCENVRPDVCLLDVEFLKTDWMKSRAARHYPGIVLPGRAYRPDEMHPGGEYYSLLNLIEANASRVKVFVNRLRKPSELRWPGKFDAVPVGLVFQVVPVGQPSDAEENLAMNVRVFEGYRPDFSVVHIRPGSWEGLVRDAYCNALDARAGHVMNYAKGRGNDPILLKLAAEITEELLRTDPTPSPTQYKNLGIAYFMLKGSDPSAAEKMIRVWTRYLEIAPFDDPEIPAIRRELSRQGK